MLNKPTPTSSFGRGRGRAAEHKDRAESAGQRYGWKARLDAFIREHVQFKQSGDGRKTSLCTRRNVTVGLFRLFGVLREGGFKIENPRSMDTKHVRFLLDWMEQRHGHGKLRSSTIQGYVSYLRILSGWIGKPDLVDEAGGFNDPAVARRSQVTDADRSWEGQGIDIGERIEAAWDIEPWVAMALLAQAAFGLRRKEAVCLIPSEDYSPGTGALYVTRGTKGGRARVIPLYTAWQYEVMAMLLDFCRRGGKRKSHIGGVTSDLKSNLRRYSYVVGDKLGITGELTGTTGHGLRAGFACRLLEAHGVTPPVRGGSVQDADPQVMRDAYTAATQATGHSRFSVVGAYVGSSRAAGAHPHPDAPDLKRLDPPDMEQTIARLRERARARLSDHRLKREVAKSHGLRAPLPVAM